MLLLLKRLLCVLSIGLVTTAYAATCWKNQDAYCAYTGDTTLWYVPGCSSSAVLTAQGNSQIRPKAILATDQGPWYSHRTWFLCCLDNNWWFGYDCFGGEIREDCAAGYYRADGDANCYP